MNRWLGVSEGRRVNNFRLYYLCSHSFVTARGEAAFDKSPEAFARGNQVWPSHNSSSTQFSASLSLWFSPYLWAPAAPSILRKPGETILKNSLPPIRLNNTVKMIKMNHNLDCSLELTHSSAMWAAEGSALRSRLFLLFGKVMWVSQLHGSSLPLHHCSSLTFR